MSFTKKTFVDGETVITANDLNGMQDELIRVAGIAGTPGENGAPGENGGYYTPSVTQPTAGTMRVSYSGSKSGMPSVPAATVALPQGPQGEQGPQGPQGEQGPQGAQGPPYELTDKDKTGIADIVLLYIVNDVYSKHDIDTMLAGYATQEYVDAAVGGIDIPVVPTKISAFTNDSGYQTAAQVSAAITAALNAIGSAEEGAY